MAEVALLQEAAEEEVLEAVSVAVLMEGGSVQPHIGLVLEALDEFGRRPLSRTRGRVQLEV